MPKPALRLTSRVLARLVEAEAREPNAHYRDDYRIARITLGYAARGYLEPQVAATYAVIGLHPEKVWPAIVARRKRQLGAFYGEDLARVLPPKKPPQSVRLPFEVETRLRVGEEREAKNKRRGWNSAPRSCLPSPAKIMATAATGYRNPERTRSENTQSLSPFQLKNFVRYSGAPRHLRDTILAAIRASDGAGVVLWPSVKGIMIEAGVCRRTVQYNRKRLCALGIWTLVRRDNSWDDGRKHFRRSATYQLDLDKLAALKRPREIRSSEWRSYKEYKAATTRRRPQHTAQHEAVPPAKAAPITTIAQPAKPQEHRTAALGSRKFERIHDRRIALTAKMGEFMRGCKGTVQTVDRGSRWIGPEDPEYREPMSKESAFLEACKILCLTAEEGRELLKFADPEQGP